MRFLSLTLLASALLCISSLSLALPLCQFTHFETDCDLPLELLHRGVSQTLWPTLSFIKPDNCIHAIAIGGSITCGGGINLTSYADSVSKSWPTMLERLLNANVPCANGRHTVTNMCRHATASDVFVDIIAEWKESLTVPEIVQANLFVVETSVNDAVDLFNHNGVVDEHKYNHVQPEDNDYLVQQFQEFTEIIITELRSFPNKPAVIYLGASTHTSAPLRSAAPAQQVVAAYYGIPYVSIIDAIGPLINTSWYSSFYHIQDCCHITAGAHFMLARLLEYCINTQMDPWGTFNASLVSNPKPHFASPALVAMYRDSKPLRFPTTLDSHDAQFRSCRNETCDNTWAYVVERGEKAGLVSRTIGSSVSYVFTPAMLEKHLRSGVIHIQALSSYEHMGSMLVTVSSHNLTLFNSSFNCSWSVPASQSVEFAAPFDKAQAFADNVLNLRITNLGGGDENKIKLISITLL